ncbi:MAG: MmgE/PrpD family protein [Thermodesulfobacteriota bacterium]
MMHIASGGEASGAKKEADAVTDRLAGFFAGTPYDAIPASAIHEARRAIVDGLGVGLGGADDPSAAILMNYCRAIDGRGEAQVWGRPERLPAELAALVNGQQAHVLDFDDTFMTPETNLHATAPLLPALLAVAETRHLGGKAVLRAFVLGFEAAARLAQAMGRAHYSAGWHVTATMGPVGAAVGVGVLIGLDRVKLRNAIGIAITHSGGVTAMHGSMCKSYHAGKGAELGLRSALLAELGFNSAPEPITDPKGYLNVAAGDRAVSRLTDRLGERYLILENGYKPYASGVLTHALIDAMAALKREGVEGDQVEKIEARVNPFVLQATGRTEPQTGLEGKFSAYHCAAVALLDGAAGKPQFTDARVLDPRVVALRRKVTFQPDEAFRKSECRVALTLAGGDRREKYIPHAGGTAENPLSDEGLAGKFADLAAPLIGDHAGRVLELIGSLERLDDTSRLTGLLAG